MKSQVRSHKDVFGVQGICPMCACCLWEVSPIAAVETRAALCWRREAPPSSCGTGAARTGPGATDPGSLEGPGLGWVSHGAPP